ncbi:MAG TPA: butyrate kinase, partial [Prolixibacteraceae bacterium]|nr:butyrate kinase [Prolixibacteraceae bacterium]
MDSPKILIINPGSTSTKIAVYQDGTCLMQHVIRHYLDELIHYPTIFSQFEFRKDMILGTLEMEGI